MQLQPQKKDLDTDPGYIFSVAAGQVAADRGQIIKYPARNELFIDIDDNSQLEMFNRRFSDLFALSTELFDDYKVVETTSRSGLPHRHIIISLTKNNKRIKLTDWQRVALQFALCSDPVKETLTVYRILTGVKDPSILFETP